MILQMEFIKKEYCPFKEKCIFLLKTSLYCVILGYGFYKYQSISGSNSSKAGKSSQGSTIIDWAEEMMISLQTWQKYSQQLVLKIRLWMMVEALILKFAETVNKMEGYNLYENTSQTSRKLMGQKTPPNDFDLDPSLTSQWWPLLMNLVTFPFDIWPDLCPFLRLGRKTIFMFALDLCLVTYDLDLPSNPS